jgi:hypothetical protein
MHHPVGKGEKENERQGTQGILLPYLADQPPESQSEFLLVLGDAYKNPGGSGSGSGFAYRRFSPPSLKGIARIGRDSRTGKLYEKESR